MCQGRVTGEFDAKETSQEEIMTAATKFLKLEALSEIGTNNHDG
jgi:hypothetical protein